MSVPHLYFYLYILGDQTTKLVDITKIVISDDVEVGNNGTFDVIEYSYNRDTNMTRIKYDNLSGSTEIPCTGKVTWYL